VSVVAARRLFVVFFAVYAIALSYPGALPFNRIRPFIFGLPFSFAWVLLWVVLAFLVFIILDRAEVAHGEDPGE
jgi:hypothetical protein